MNPDGDQIGTATQRHDQTEQHLKQMLTTYDDLNSTVIEELYEEPSALEFLRFVAKNRPFVLRGGAEHWTAFQQWNAEYLLRAMGDSLVNVAITPSGNADAIVEGSAGDLLYVEPLEKQELFREVLNYVRESEKPGWTGPVKYAQTQNDNLRNEYDDLFADVPASISFARIALDREPDAVNFWLGNSRSVTSLHKDNYENVYAQIRGQKHFVLLPPICAPCVNEQQVSRARYELLSNGLQPEVAEPPETVPVPTWDPDVADIRANTYSSLTNPIRVTLEQGDMLYLPAMWYHKVSQSCGDEGFSCSVNYW